MAADSLRNFSLAVQCPDQAIDLGRAALALAQLEYPEMEIQSYVARMDGIAARVESRTGAETDAYRRIAAINLVLFREGGFRGNQADYYDPRNSFLNDVLDRKTGLPITLSVLYIEVAKRVGLSVEGVGFPGHFLVKCVGPDDEIILDPFHQGEVRTPEDLEELLARIYRGQVSFRPEFLFPVSKRQILKRMLHNLKGIYLRRGEFGKGLSVMERLVILEPHSAHEIRDRGLLYLKLECFPQALKDLEAYLAMASDADDQEIIRDQVVSLKKLVTQIH